MRWAPRVIVIPPRIGARLDRRERVRAIRACLTTAGADEVRIERGAITPMNRTDVPASLIAVLQKGMATRREDRFASALDFGRALQRVEMELGYARTELEVPNLHLRAPERPTPEADDDETRVRQVATIDAQPAVAPAPATVAPVPVFSGAFVPPPSQSPVEETTLDLYTAVRDGYLRRRERQLQQPPE